MIDDVRYRSIQFFCFGIFRMARQKDIVFHNTKKSLATGLCSIGWKLIDIEPLLINY